MADRVKYRDLVREVALDNYGYLTTAEAVDVGVPAIELPKPAARGGLQSIAYGLYRVTDIPPTPYDQFAEAILRVGDGAFLYGESVLALLELADVNPRRINVAVSRRVRSKLPPFIELTRCPRETPLASYHGLSSQPVADAILTCRAIIEDERLQDDAKRARSEGLLTPSEWKKVRWGLRH